MSPIRTAPSDPSGSKVSSAGTRGPLAWTIQICGTVMIQTGPGPALGERCQIRFRARVHNRGGELPFGVRGLADASKT